MQKCEEMALELAIVLFAGYHFSDRQIPEIALAVVTAAPTMRGASIEEMLCVHEALCFALITLSDQAGVDQAGVN